MTYDIVQQNGQWGHERDLAYLDCVIAPSLEPSLPVLVVPGMKDLLTNELLHVLISLKTWA